MYQSTFIIIDQVSYCLCHPRRQYAIRRVKGANAGDEDSLGADRFYELVPVSPEKDAELMAAYVKENEALRAFRKASLVATAPKDLLEAFPTGRKKRKIEPFNPSMHEQTR